MLGKEIKKHGLPGFVAGALAEQLDQAGTLLYSSHDTIGPGNIYLLGLNPGGHGGPSLRERLAILLTQEHNAYLDEAWENRRGSYDKGEAPLQRRVKWLLRELGANPRDVLSTNLIFMQSRDASGVSSEQAELCWPVHEVLLNIVRPRTILSFGNSNPSQNSFSTYSFLHTRYGGCQRCAPSGHGNWSIKGFKAYMPWGDVFVVGLPHLSRYDPTNRRDVIDWIKSGGSDIA